MMDEVARDVQWVEVRVALEPQERVPEVSHVVTERIDARELPRQPSGEDIDREWKSVHLDEQRDEKRREGSETFASHASSSA